MFKETLNTQVRLKDKVIKEYVTLVASATSDIATKDGLLESIKIDNLTKDANIKEYLNMISSMNPTIVRKVGHIRGDIKIENKPEQTKKDNKKKRSHRGFFCYKSNPEMPEVAEIVAPTSITSNIADMTVNVKL